MQTKDWESRKRVAFLLLAACCVYMGMGIHVARADQTADASRKLVPCQPVMVKNLFPNLGINLYKILITDLATSERNTDFMTMSTTGWIVSASQGSIAMIESMKESPKGNEDYINSRPIQAVLVHCTVASHDEARRIGQAAGAQLVVWGHGHVEEQDTIAAGPSSVNVKVTAAPGAQIGSHNRIEAGPGAKVQTGIIVNNSNVYQNNAYPDFDFQLNLTLVSWRGALVKSEQIIELGPLGLSEFSFPRHYFKTSDLMTNVISYMTLLIDIINKYEHKNEEMLKSYVVAMSGFLPNAANPGHWIFLTRGTLAMRQKNRELADRMFQRAAQACGPKSPRCSAEVALALGWFHTQEGDAVKAQAAYARALQLCRQHGYADLTQRLLAHKPPAGPAP